MSYSTSKMSLPSTSPSGKRSYFTSLDRAGPPARQHRTTFLRVSMLSHLASKYSALPSIKRRTGVTMERSSTEPMVQAGNSGVYKKKLRGEITLISYISASSLDRPFMKVAAPQPEPKTTTFGLPPLLCVRGGPPSVPSLMPATEPATVAPSANALPKAESLAAEAAAATAATMDFRADFLARQLRCRPRFGRATSASSAATAVAAAPEVATNTEGPTNEEEA
mmetsp:Transcript_39804/g.102918  ORF Transcript_39804/g.102918 Transcript_39804/m.102918 type:complete len:223 (-) Transcript_39804:181-849(-)